jgi:hypothetical protein
VIEAVDGILVAPMVAIPRQQLAEDRPALP